MDRLDISLLFAQAPASPPYHCATLIGFGCPERESPRLGRRPNPQRDRNQHDSRDFDRERSPGLKTSRI
jgi:hypothetical protein